MDVLKLSLLKMHTNLNYVMKIGKCMRILERHSSVTNAIKLSIKEFSL